MHYLKSKKILLFLFILIFSLNIFGYIYTVQAGDNLTKISKKTGIAVQLIIGNNQFLAEQKYLKLNQKIVIPGSDDFIYQVRSGDNIYEISKKLFIKPETILNNNSIKNPNNIYIGQKLKIPYDKLGDCFNKNTEVSWPIVGYITSDYGYRIHPIYKVKKFHSGIDIAAPEGTPIFSATDGIITELIEDESGYGKHVIIQGAKYQYLYGHMSKFNVVPGVVVHKGDLIGEVGNTGLSTGPHLHFQINDLRKSSVNPRYFLGNIKYAYVYPQNNYAMGGE